MAIAIAVGGLSGGLSSAIAGGKFSAGFRQGLITSGLNHVAHSVFSKPDNGYRPNGSGGSGTFSGDYEYLSGSASLDSTGVLTPGLSASIGLAFGVATSKSWVVISLGGAGSLAGGISTPVALQFGKGIGRINFLQPVGPKSSVEIIESWLK
ncbi:hypothetical protein [Moheibacter sp.]|uniref:hypothetical protein n=1 Tax=Moheibacter sp. TaxID=1965316 RepID=UPI003C71CC0B